MLKSDISRTDPVVHIPGLGTLRGELDRNVPVVRFLGVPFATVNKRWNPATPVQSWEGVRDTTRLGPSPPQPTKLDPFWAKIGGDIERPYDEVFSERDCLNVNIFAPHGSVVESDKPLPVMVWIYGGSFRIGGNLSPIYDATNLVARSIELNKPVIVVCINYRLNFFGFLASKELKEEIDNDPILTGEQKAVGNWGLQDQKLAFLWVRDHIAAFGGNPKDVTAFGESVGAECVGYHMMMPAHHGLFQRAIIQSGAPLDLPEEDIEHQSQKYFDDLASHFGISKDTPAKDKIARLRAIPEKDLAEFVAKYPAMCYRPTIDGVLIHGHVQEWYKDVSRLDPGVKRVLIGMNHDEGTFANHHGGMKAYQWPDFRARFGPPDELSSGFDKIYGQPRAGEDDKTAQANVQVTTDLVFAVPVLAFTTTLLKAQDRTETSMYFFNRTLAYVEEEFPGVGASHYTEMPYLFDSPYHRKHFAKQEAAFAKELQKVWLDIATGSSDADIPVVKELSWRGQGGPKNVIAFQRDFKIGRTDIDWISHETFDYWTRFYDYQLKQLAKGDYFSHGFQYNMAPHSE
ncbi:hypothetical protein BGZ73_008788 [Actinomortierella ambigua]|nr:hypothetical protein BGZ73_008788 [Actinomortierella ambigua]